MDKKDSKAYTYCSRSANELYRSLREALVPLYGVGEAQAVAFLVLEKVFCLSRTDIYCGKVIQISEDERTRFLNISKRLVNGEPVQYALGEAEFMSRTFEVTPAVLIPRPETEELVQWAASLVPTSGTPRILDAGTGSGCIAVSLKCLCPNAMVEAWDLSTDALEVAKRNAQHLGAEVNFRQRDMLSSWHGEGEYDVIVSNPPYIMEKEKTDMEAHVLEHEPHLALFVPDTDPLLFYRALAEGAMHHLSPRGHLLVEINRALATETAHLFRTIGLEEVEVRQDVFGNARMVKGRLGDDAPSRRDDA